MKRKDKGLLALVTLAPVRRQLKRMSVGTEPSNGVSPRGSLVLDRIHMNQLTKRYRDWREHPPSR